MKAGLIKAAAKRAGAVVKVQPGRKTFIVEGDVAKFADELMPIPDAPFLPADCGASGRRNRFGWLGAGRTDRTGERALPHSTSEVIATVDDPATISWFYQLPEDDLAIKAIAYKLAKTQNVDKVEGLLVELSTSTASTSTAGLERW